LNHQFADFAGLSEMGRAMVAQVLVFTGAFWILIGREMIAVAVFVSLRHAWYVPIFAWLRATMGTFPFVWAGAHLYGSSEAFIGMLIGDAGTAVLANLSVYGSAQDGELGMVNVEIEIVRLVWL
jgi:hypothetical protein